MLYNIYYYIIIWNLHNLILSLDYNNKYKLYIMEIYLDTPFEVTENQYNVLMSKFPGVVAGRYDEDNNKYYIKVWLMKYKPYVEDILKNNN